ncbi:hypothetical protein [Geodermatophilus sp. SYSU D00696]
MKAAIRASDDVPADLGSDDRAQDLLETVRAFYMDPGISPAERDRVTGGIFRIMADWFQRPDRREADPEVNTDVPLPDVALWTSLDPSGT